MPSARFCLSLLAALLCHGASAQAWSSAIVREGADGRLEYVTDAEGNRVPDFSDAGYRGGGVPLPVVPTVATISPMPGDNTAAIQAVLDFVGARTPDATGFRGAVELTAGTFRIDGTLALRQSGVVLRGAGDGADPTSNTILTRSGANQAAVVFLGRPGSSGGDALIRRLTERPEALVTDAVVPIGAATISVDPPGLYAVGDAVVLFHPDTPAWIASVNGGGTAGDAPWAPGEQPIPYVRTITAVDGASVTLDAPVFARLDRSLSQSTLYLRSRTNVVEKVGVESLRIDIATVGPDDETQAENAVVIGLAEDAWAQNVTALHFWHAGISVQASLRVTVRDCEALDPVSLVTGERRYNFEADRSQLVLFQGNRATFARHAYVGNGTTRDSGIVFLDNTSENAFTSSEAHRRWGTGFLYDNHTEVGSSGSSSGDRRIHLGNRGDFGTGHGWACANCVVWNAQMNGALVIVEKPPTAQNYAIGVQGQVSDRGPFLANTGPYVEGTNMTGLDPRSLYLRQIADRVATAEAPPPASDRGAHLVRVSPNPTTGRSEITFELSAGAQVRLSVVDVLGREVLVASDRAFGPGAHSVSLRAEALPAGVYLVRFAATSGADATLDTLRFTRSR